MEQNNRTTKRSGVKQQQQALECLKQAYESLNYGIGLPFSVDGQRIMMRRSQEYIEEARIAIEAALAEKGGSK